MKKLATLTYHLISKSIYMNLKAFATGSLRLHSCERFVMKPRRAYRADLPGARTFEAAQTCHVGGVVL